MSGNSSVFDLNCTACPRLSDFLKEVREKFPHYHARPVPPFGVRNPKLLIVGLAPGLHGANATGRPFTGDHAGIILYEMLYKHGFSNKETSTDLKDGLKLRHCRITNAVKCLPPENKPVGEEINTCNSYLVEELKAIDKKAVILCLGLISHKAVIKALGLKQSDYPFKHGGIYLLDDGRTIIDSYHCSRYNTNTKRLTEDMFSEIFIQIKAQLKI
jgi:uracil-DNA glycosylase family 4